MATSVFDYEHLCDDLGPAQIVHLHDPASGLRAVVVVDNVACGASMEFRDGSESDALGEIADKIGRNTREVLERSRDEDVQPRRAATDFARARVERAMALRARS